MEAQRIVGVGGAFTAGVGWVANQVNGGSIACPRCGRVDRVQRVSAVVSAGISTGIGGTRQMLMSQRLAPPEQPMYRSPMRGFPLVLLVLALALGVAALLVPRWFAAVHLPLPALFLTPAVLALVWTLFSSQRGRARVRWAMPAWERAIARWYELYYCGRDDGVYLPGDNELVSVELMGTVLYAPE